MLSAACIQLHWFPVVTNNQQLCITYHESLPNFDTKDENVNKRNENECGLKLPFHEKRLYGHASVKERCMEFICYLT